MDYTVWINNANAKIGHIQSGDIFVLKDLYEGVDWNNLSKGERLGFGKYFKNEVKEGRVPGIQYVGKAQNNSAQYIKL